jgi:hypothetical protein
MSVYFKTLENKTFIHPHKISGKIFALVFVKLGLSKLALDQPASGGYL